MIPHPGAGPADQASGAFAALIGMHDDAGHLAAAHRCGHDQRALGQLGVVVLAVTRRCPVGREQAPDLSRQRLPARRPGRQRAFLVLAELGPGYAQCRQAVACGIVLSR